MKSLLKQIEKMNVMAFAFLKHWLMVVCACQSFILIRALLDKSSSSFLTVQTLRLEQFYIVVTFCLVIICSVVIDCVVSKKIV